MKKVGILGGGQLGKMLLQAAANYPVTTYILEQDADAPAVHLCHHYVQGSITSYDDVYAFGKGLDCITIEIENVNLEALTQLELEGVTIIPSTSVLKIITNKITQKQYYQQHQIPTAPYIITHNLADVAANQASLPAVHKLAQGGYDGKGVQVLHHAEDIPNAYDAPAVLEHKLEISKEIAITIAIDAQKRIAIYPAVEMVFHKHLNMLDYQLCPATLPQQLGWKAEAIALSVAKNFGSPGLYAVELIIDTQNDVYVNETAPRVHNSGHHTIEAHYSSQFDMLWRIILSYPLGNTKALLPSLMLNLVGAPNHTGVAVYQGLHEALCIDNCYVHIYGKKETKPGRKMGHVTIISAEPQELIHQANKIKAAVSVLAAT